MKTYGQHAQDLDRIVGVKVMYWLSAHTPAGYQRAQTVNSMLEASAWSCQLISLQPARRASAKTKCGSQSGSQQAQTPGHVWQPPANIAAGQGRHIGRRWATSGGWVELLWEQEAAGSNPAIPTAVGSPEIEDTPNPRQGSGLCFAGCGLVRAAGGLAGASGVEGELAREFAGGGVDNADVEVLDEQDELGPGVGPAGADVVDRPRVRGVNVPLVSMMSAWTR